MKIIASGGIVQYFNPRSREGSDNCAGAKSGERKISIHAPAKGATKLRFLPMLTLTDFNPRSREGSDGTDRLKRHYDASNFNPRSREGSDENSTELLDDLYEFQSTLPRRERQKKLIRQK